MIWMIMLGAIALIFGVLLLAAPGSLLKISAELNRMVTRIDEQVLKYRIGVGVVLLIAAVFLFAYAYMVKVFK